MSTHWPDIPYPAWRDTCATLHLWTQIVGKVRLARTPWLNHGWHVPLYVTSRGLTTSLIPYDDRSFEMHFDFIDHVLDVTVTDGNARMVALAPRTVADFYGAVMQALTDLDVPVEINQYPSEIPDAIPFARDTTHASYDGDAAQRFWRALVQVDRVFKAFRTRFLGKASPVHFFWGSFDLAVTRFSGRRAPAFQGKVPGVKIEVMREAYSHEVSSAGFWPGGGGIDFAAFYSYAYPAPERFKDQTVRPSTAYFHPQLAEFVLPYDAVRTASDPDATLLDFLQSTYEAAAVTASWDRAALECGQGVPGVCRTID
ncbi:MAG TPA: DUF5996 family protein [Steroidobacteraceae bacterium]|jgi:hypothetical protein|nr:DUF5996 family protein [Steroidobacteraceae bacterium]